MMGVAGEVHFVVGLFPLILGWFLGLMQGLVSLACGRSARWSLAERLAADPSTGVGRFLFRSERICESYRFMGGEFDASAAFFPMNSLLRRPERIVEIGREFLPPCGIAHHLGDQRIGVELDRGSAGGGVEVSV